MRRPPSPTHPAWRGVAPTPPHHRFTPADERTLLAWLRTGLALVAGGVAVAEFAPDLGVRWGSPAVAVALTGRGAAATGDAPVRLAVAGVVALLATAVVVTVAGAALVAVLSPR